MTLTATKITNISVIIPTRNEEVNIAKTIISARAEAFEVIVVDSGSDKTAEIARQLECQVITAPEGRASQMNVGGRAATGEILLFLHGDTLLPKHFSREVHKLLNKPQIVCGAFGLHLDQPGIAARIIEFFTNIRAKLFGMPYGDQAIFMYKSLFNSVNGYEDVSFLEDVLLVKTMKTYGKIAISGHKVSTSGRRWQKRGIVITSLINRLIILGFLLGFSPKRLQNWYGIGKK
jgi:rSAM/selenodomain-associated transferase 2